MATLATLPLPVLLPQSTVRMLENCKTVAEVSQVHAQLIKTNLTTHTFSASKIIAFYCSYPGGLRHALSVLKGIPSPNFFIYFLLIKSFCGSETPFVSISLYVEMLSNLSLFDGIENSIPKVLKSCGKTMASQEGKQIHGQILKTHFKLDPFVSNSLIRMYSEFGETEHARKVFDKMLNRDVISWNSMISGYLKAGEIVLARQLFDEMPNRDLVACNAMIDGYGKSGRLKLAEELFDQMEEKDVITWTSMITTYVINGYPMKALNLFRRMLTSSNIKPDAPAIVSALSAIADLGFIEEGRWIHAYLNSNNININFGFISSALIDMYSKCGYIDTAYTLFKTISHRRKIADFNSMISGFAFHGLGQQASAIFTEMEVNDIKPDGITFIGVLNGCSHAGLVDKGKYYFELMQNKYKIAPLIQHYGCMVDLFARAGHLDKALEVIEAMPMEADVLAWKSILTASLKHGQYVLGESAALKAIELDPEDSSSYILLSNIYAKSGKWENVSMVRRMTKKKGVRKVPGCSSIMVDGEMHEFLAGKKMGTNCSEAILEKIDEMICRLKIEGYEPDLSQVLLDVEEDGKERSLRLHSEKMAVASGLINMKRGENPIHVMKNLRICCDCHNFIKLVSKVYECRVIVRDLNRFHHFENGSCSCKDYW